MCDAAPSFNEAIEDSLAVPPDQHSVVSNSSNRSPRRWDDPPEEGPGAPPPENITTMVFIKGMSVRPYLVSEILQLIFPPSGTHIAATFPEPTNTFNYRPDGARTLSAWDAATGQRLAPPSYTGANPSRFGVALTRGFAFKPSGTDMIVACPYLYGAQPHQPIPRLEIYDLGRRKRLLKQELPIRAPLAWSPDGTALAAVSLRDPRRVVMLNLDPADAKHGSIPLTKPGQVLMGHLDEIVLLAFLPASGKGGALVSAGKDGQVRITSVESGRTLRRIEVAARLPPSILQVSPGGDLVVTVWGRDVVVWYLDTGRVHTYNLNAVRQAEGWPLAVSPDCRYLACRTEDGVDVSDVATGKFRGEFPRSGPPATAAAFDRDGRRLVIGDYTGGLQLLEVITA
ncbi:YVTN repeat-like/Quino protein amine dehydrogenase [Canariomyces notabilis]|uniref:YVTN repeat-like/Quino protein amine dehydrogenase n=1 Tax=Canariomyces notabilis TaxID=2074819 RepID=A0AAN6QKE1_9PEZI|nr:YVTN repeat-like/Quino protein amine dehydrogenase [Canariomyces arenarius]